MQKISLFFRTMFGRNIPVLLFASVIGVILFQIVYAGRLTHLESALLNSFQFILSICLGWYFSFLSLEREFNDRLKGKAIYAFRRINEIRRNIYRLIQFTSQRSENLPKEIVTELEVIQQVAIGAFDAASSSVEDWSDIISDDINILQEREALQEEKLSMLVKKEHLTQESKDSSELDSKIEKINIKINELTKKLPEAFSSTATTTTLVDYPEYWDLPTVTSKSSVLLGMLTTTIRGIWQQNPKSELSIFELSEGDELLIKKGNHQAELFDMGNKKLGVIKYDAISALTRIALEQQKRRIKVISVNRIKDSEVEFKYSSW